MKKEEEWEMEDKNEGIFYQRKKINGNERLKLKKLIHKMKIDNLVNNFIKKISMNNI